MGKITRNRVMYAGTDILISDTPSWGDQTNFSNLKLLKRKLSHALEKAGFDEIAIFFDDIDISNFGQEAADKDLGKKHAEVLNEVSMHFPKQKNIWFCPSIYNLSLSKGIFDEGYLLKIEEFGSINNLPNLDLDVIILSLEKFLVYEKNKGCLYWRGFNRQNQE